MKKWDQLAMQISECRYHPTSATLSVAFGNRDKFHIPVEVLVPGSAGGVSWEEIRIGETRDFLEVPVRGGITEVPWDRIRTVADPEYRRWLADRAAESARRVGERLRTLRRESGLTQSALAASAGVDRVTISRIENAQLQASFKTLSRLVAAMGRSLRDLAVVAETTVAASHDVES